MKNKEEYFTFVKPVGIPPREIFGMRKWDLPWLPAIFAHVVALALIFPDSYQQDGGYHFLTARWGWRHPEYLVGAWTRPLFTTIYSLPAQLGYVPARLFTGLVICATGYLAYRLAHHLGFRKPWLVFPFLFLQPSVMLLSFDTMTEPLFGLLLVAVLYAHASGRPWTAAILVSLLPTVRPEGFFIGVFWGFAMLVDQRIDARLPRRLLKTLVLLLGSAAWWLAAWAVTGDFLFVIHNWSYRGQDVLGRATALWFLKIGPEVAGPVILVFFLVGLARELSLRRWMLPILALWFFAFQSVLWIFGLFATAGYARYFVCIGPVVAILASSTVDGIVVQARRPRLLTVALAGTLVVCWAYAIERVSWWPSLYDAYGNREAYDWYRANGHPPPQRLAWSHGYMCILFDADPASNPLKIFRPRAHNMDRLEKLAPGTLVFWDGDFGPNWYGLSADDLERAGLRRLYSKKHVYRRLLYSLYAKHMKRGFKKLFPREQEVFLFRKEP